MQISGSPPRTKAITPQKLAFDTASGATYVANMDDNTGSVLGP
jgi:DNA-binding beta-propeller fold protein YncE